MRYLAARIVAFPFGAVADLVIALGNVTAYPHDLEEWTVSDGLLTFGVALVDLYWAIRIWGLR